MTSLNFKLLSTVYVLIGSTLFAALFLPIISSWPNGIIVDDGYFYLNIAYFLGTEFFSSFDGLNPTSGYHLLWALLLAPIAFLSGAVGLTKTGFLIISFSLAVALIAFLVREFYDKFATQLCAFVTIIFSFSMTEAALLLALTLPLLRAMVEPKRINARVAAIACFCIPLTRIDASIYGIIFIFASYFLGNRQYLKRWALCLVLGIITHFGLMLLITGDLFSVSSILKASHHIGNNPAEAMYHNVTLSRASLVRTYQLTLCLSLFIYFANKNREDDKKQIFLVIAFCTAAWFVYFSTMPLRVWYWTVPLGLSLWLFENKSRRSKTGNYLCIGVCLWLTFLYVFAIAQFNLKYERDQAHARHFIAAANQMIDDNGRVFQVDGSGYTGFFISTPVVNGDGLVNSQDYAKALKRNGLQNYLEEKQICYLIANQKIEGGVVVSKAGLEVRVSDVEELISPLEKLRSQFSQFRLFILKDDRCRVQFESSDRKTY